MATFTVVDEGYEVQVFKSVKAVCAAMGNQNLYLNCEIYDDLRHALSVMNAGRSVCLYRTGVSDWIYKIKKH